MLDTLYVNYTPRWQDFVLFTAESSALRKGLGT